MVARLNLLTSAGQCFVLNSCHLATLDTLEDIWANFFKRILTVHTICVAMSHHIMHRARLLLWGLFYLKEWHLLQKFTKWGAGMAQWWEHSPPTNVARVRFSVPVSYVGWVCCWFLSLLRGFFSGFSCFPPSTKTNISKLDLESVDEEPLCGDAAANSNLKRLICIKINKLALQCIWSSPLNLFYLLVAMKLILPYMYMSKAN